MNALQTTNTYNKIIRYRLDDKQYFTDLLKRENATEQAVAEIIGDKEYFTAIFTLYGHERNGSISIDRYELTDNNGQKNKHKQFERLWTRHYYKRVLQTFLRT